MENARKFPCVAIHFDPEEFSCTHFRCQYDEDNNLMYAENINVNVCDFIKFKGKTYLVMYVRHNRNYMVLSLMEVRIIYEKVIW